MVVVLSIDPGGAEAVEVGQNSLGDAAGNQEEPGGGQTKAKKKKYIYIYCIYIVTV